MHKPNYISSLSSHRLAFCLPYRNNSINIFSEFLPPLVLWLIQGHSCKSRSCRRGWLEHLRNNNLKVSFPLNPMFVTWVPEPLVFYFRLLAIGFVTPFPHYRSLNLKLTRQDKLNIFWHLKTFAASFWWIKFMLSWKHHQKLHTYLEASPTPIPNSEFGISLKSTW